MIDKGFTLGCNYWASHAGTYMWRNWDESVVENDLKLLSECGIETLRVFPLWEDFQPITFYHSGRREMRINGKPLDKSPEGVAGVDPVMIERFEKFVKIADKYGLKLLVCLINGWMSGRMFFPPAFYNRNPITCKTAVKWEIRFVKYFVERFKGFKNIVAWEPGNETNVLCWVENQKPAQDEYWVWLSTIVNTIRAADNTRPVVAGLHGLQMRGQITPSDIGEICDVTTVHPYPAYVPHCYTDSIASMKSRLHSTAESTFYSDLGQKPCLCEEIGTLGNMLGCEETAAVYLKANMNSLWANGNTGVLWWCAHDQTNLDFPPYDWCGLERELGIIRTDGSYKPLADVIKNMKEFTNSFQTLPPRRRHAVCILTPDQDNWAVAYTSFIMAKQAGFELQFADSDYEIPKSDVYIMPSLCDQAMPLRTQNELLRRVREEGAVLYISWNDAFVSDLEKISGCKILGNSERRTSEKVTFDCMGESLTLYSKRRLDLSPVDCEVLAREQDSNPALTVKNYGKGKIYFLSFAPEIYLADQKNAFYCEEGKKYYKLYEYLLKKHTDCIVTEKSSPFIGITEHPLDNGSFAITAVNYSDSEIEFDLKIKESLKISKINHGNITKKSDTEIKATLGAGDILIFETKE
ncbi:MAG: cellulase family glycosylhydrolase [Clostridia bacterium]|nr:cellulase family glycosylhydrolase [Clostridia bacterium]